MDKDQVKGAVNDAAGRVKRQVGEWTGDTERPGGRRRAAGEGQSAESVGQRERRGAQDASDSARTATAKQDVSVSANMEREREAQRARNERQQRCTRVTID